MAQTETSKIGLQLNCCRYGESSLHVNVAVENKFHPYFPLHIVASVRTILAHNFEVQHS